MSKINTDLITPSTKSIVEITLPPQKKSVGFYIVKYSVAWAPILIPFIIAMFATGYNIDLSILMTLAIDFTILIVLTVYYFINGVPKDMVK